MRCASTRSLVATAIQKSSRATARICWPCTPLRRPANERTPATGAAPRLVCRAPPQIRDTLALALLLSDARTTITFDHVLIRSDSCAEAGSILRHRPLTYGIV